MAIKGRTFHHGTGRWLAALALILGAVNLESAQSAEPNLGRHHYRVTTRSREAQRHFDRGLTLAYGFSHDAAIQEFRAALKEDPQCAMAWWGIALVNGPHINFPLVPPDRAAAAWEALTHAQSLAGGGNETERALIGALGKRYANPQPENRAPLDEAYAAAMGEVWRAHPRDADVGTLYAEALMDLHPWDFWTHEGKPQPWTAEVVTTLERVLRLDSRNPGANHLYIHAVEASEDPGRATRAANRLGRLAPGSSHLVHMPSHIYVRTGRWGDSAGSNLRAMTADIAYREAFPNPGFYAVYMAHNQHFYAYSAFMEGRSADAIRSAREMVADIPEEFLKAMASAMDGFMIFVPEALMRFGRWDEILAEPEPRPGLPYSKAVWHYSRAAALTALNRPEEAARERTLFENAILLVPAAATFGNNKCVDLLGVARQQLNGEMAAKAGRLDEAIVSLREAGNLEDKLRYAEPPDWIQPTRHTLGAVLLRAGRVREAEAVYREDLAHYPENGWSLFGLSRTLRRDGRIKEAKSVERRFAKAWAHADVTLRSTCFCQQTDEPGPIARK